MTKPVFPPLAANDQGWDAQVDTLIDILSDEGYPLAEYADFTAWDLVVAQRDETIALVTLNDDDDYTDYIIVFGDGGSTKKVGWQWNEVPELTDSSGGSDTDVIVALTDPADAPATADDLRDDLVANLIPELRDNLASLTDQVNLLIAAGKDTGGMASAP